MMSTERRAFILYLLDQAIQERGAEDDSTGTTIPNGVRQLMTALHQLADPILIAQGMVYLEKFPVRVREIIEIGSQYRLYDEAIIIGEIKRDAQHSPYLAACLQRDYAKAHARAKSPFQHAMIAMTQAILGDIEAARAYIDAHVEPGRIGDLQAYAREVILMELIRRDRLEEVRRGIYELSPAPWDGWPWIDLTLTALGYEPWPWYPALDGDD